MKNSTDEFLNVQKAAKLLDLSAKTVRRWAQESKIKGFKIGTRGDWRFNRNELLKLLKKIGGGK